MLRAALD